MALADDIKHYASQLGFVAVGVAPATPLVEHERTLAARIAAGNLAALSYFTADRPRLAARPRALLPGARAVLSLAFPCASADEPRPATGGHGLIARYARGRDYHQVAKERLALLVDFLAARVPGAACRPFVDATPLLERAFAARAGLGWFGKNNCFIVPGRGSWVLLAEVLTEIPLDADAPAAGDCGDCQACLDACPTGALSVAYVHHTARCLSYLTTELRGPLPEGMRPLLGERVLGCDTCQSVCPRNAGVGGAWQDLTPVAGLSTWLELPPLFGLAEAEFADLFRGTAATRPRRRGLLRNAAVVLGNLGDREAVPALVGGLGDAEPLVRGHAAWALGRLGGRRAREALARALAREDDAHARAELAKALERAG
jgi:epoxyqueuosine reductase